MMHNPLSLDLDHVLNHTRNLWEEMRGERLFITGGTGFFGCWLLETFAYINEKLQLKSSVLVLTRNVEAFRKKAPHLVGNPSIHFLEGDVRTFPFPEGKFTFVIHAAADTDGSIPENPLNVFEIITQGTQHILDFSRTARTKKLLMVSSGAVYGKQPSNLMHIPETYSGSFDMADGRFAYGEGKRIAEFFCLNHHSAFGMEIKIARCFAFLGPYLSLESNYAASNFLRDALNGETIRIKGDGTPLRSYLYAGDLAVWLWTMLFNGRGGSAYNVGSEQAVSIADLARMIAGIFPGGRKVIIQQKPNGRVRPQRYIPSTIKAYSELGLTQKIQLEDALTRTVAWHRDKSEV